MTTRIHGVLSRLAPSLCAAFVALPGTLTGQQGAAIFDAPVVVLDADSPPFQHLADFDGDGDLDAIGARQNFSTPEIEVAAWRNDAGTFVRVWSSYFGGYDAYPLLDTVLGDFDGDGRKDLLCIRGRTLVQLRSAAGFTFQPTSLTLAHYASGGAVGDFDGDGRDDVALQIVGVAPGVEVRLGNGTQLFAPIVPAVAASKPIALQADADARQEAGIVADGVQVLAFDCDGVTLTAGPVLTTLVQGAAGSYRWVPGDVDGDGDVDLAVFHPAFGAAPAQYELFRHDGTGLVTEGVATGGPAESFADVDGDGDLDGLRCAGPPNTTTWFPTLVNDSPFEVAHNDGSGGFAVAIAFPGAGSLRNAGAGDLDGDGDQDLVAGSCVYYGRGPLVAQPMPGDTGTDWYRSIRNLPHDHDRDGDLDVVVAPGSGSQNRGDGTFAPLAAGAVQPPAGRRFGPAIHVDHDGDGADDFVVPQFDTASGQFEVMVLLRNNGGGSYTDAGPVTAPGVQVGFGSEFDRFVVADLDGDGDLDVIANFHDYSRFAASYWRQGSTYVPGVTFPLQWIDGVADFDGDGRPDLFGRSGTEWYVHVGTGNASAPFAPPLTVRPASHVGERAVVDCNDDGRPDLLVPEQEAVLLVNLTPPGGTPTFVASTLTGTPGAGVTRVTSGDFDGDGRTDLAFGMWSVNPTMGATRILLRTTNAAVPGPADYRVVRQAVPAGTAADADGDGDLDILGGRVSRNLRFAGPGAGLRRQYGDGAAGEAGAVPVLGARGVLRPGNTVGLSLTGVPGPTLVALDLGFAPAAIPNTPFPGLTLYVDPNGMLTATVAVLGDGQGRAAASFVLPIGLDAGLAGSTFYLQAFVLDAAAPNWFSCSNGLRIGIGS